MTKITPTEYLAEHLQTWDYGDKIKFIAVLSEVLTAFGQSDDYLDGLLYLRWCGWLYGWPTDEIYTRGEFYALAHDLLSRVQAIGKGVKPSYPHN